MASLDSARSEASRVAASVDLKDVRVWRLNSELISVPGPATRLSYTFGADLDVQFDDDDSVLIVFGSYKLDIGAVPDRSADGGDADAESDERDQVALIEFDLNALFEVDREPGEAFSESELTAFGHTTGQFALYPYARELVSDVTNRLGLPALHMGVLRLSLDSKDG